MTRREQEVSILTVALEMYMSGDSFDKSLSTYCEMNEVSEDELQFLKKNEDHVQQLNDKLEDVLISSMRAWSFK